jgi:hypothetical protein
MTTQTLIHSIYIPRIMSCIATQDLIIEFQEYGPISRIDFTPVNQKPGFSEDISSDIKSAFVHFYYPLPFEMSDAIQQNNPYKWYPKYVHDPKHAYWLILPNKNPVQTTMMNSAQIVENCRYLEQKVEAQQTKIDQLETTLTEMRMFLYEYELKLNSLLQSR